MADQSKQWNENAPGDFFVDRTCIDCDQCREIAPETFGGDLWLRLVLPQRIGNWSLTRFC